MKEEDLLSGYKDGVMGSIIKFCLLNRFVVLLSFLLIAAAGIYVAPFEWKFLGDDRPQVAVDAIPDIGENQQIIFTEWNGRSPQDIEDQITYPLTTALLGLPGVKTVRSNSYFGFSSIYVIFKDEIEFYWSRSRVLEKLSSLPKGTLPEGVKPQLGPDATGLGQVYQYTLEGRDPKGSPIGGWDLQEIRSIQDWNVRYALAATEGIAEVASVGGFSKEYQIDLNPSALQNHNIKLGKVLLAVKMSNLDIGAKTLEINKAEYFIRGLGFVKNKEDLEQIVIKVSNNVPILLKDIASISEGPAIRRGALDKGGAEVVGGTVVARFGYNPMQAINNLKINIDKLQGSLGKKVVVDYAIVKQKQVDAYANENNFESRYKGRLNQKSWLKHLNQTDMKDWPKWINTSTLTIVPYYDRSKLITETLGTLEKALIEELLVTIIVVLIMVFHLRSSILISSLLPVAILLCFLAMKVFKVDANIVALSGIAIAIGTMVDMGIVLCENILKHIDQNKGDEKHLLQVIYEGTVEVGSAVLTAVATTIISFLPVFALEGAEGKLFKPLAYTKSFALIASIIVALMLIPVISYLFFGKSNLKEKARKIIGGLGALVGISIIIMYSFFWGILIFSWSIYYATSPSLDESLKNKLSKLFNIIFASITLIFLSNHWEPLGPGKGLSNFFFTLTIIGGLLLFAYLIIHFYEPVLNFCLHNRLIFLPIPIFILLIGWQVYQSIGREFRPSLDEGSFLYMPSTSHHASIGESMDALRKQDMGITNIPEIESVVGKIGRVESSLDPAPISMVETIINYKSEYKQDKSGNKISYRYDNTKKDFIQDKAGKLIPDLKGKPFRQWRDHIKSPNDIWKEIVSVTKIPGSTSAPKLQPIETRIIMLQSGMRSPMGIKIYGPSLEVIEKFGYRLEELLKTKMKTVEPLSVLADKVVGKPYIEIKINRPQIARYGLSLVDVQDIIKAAIGGVSVTNTVEGRERYPIRVRYQREKRDNIEEINRILVPTPSGAQIPLSQVATIQFVKGPQSIKSENTFKVAYLTFDKKEKYSESDVVENIKEVFKELKENNELVIPKNVWYEFAGNFKNEERANKRLMLVLPIALLLILIILYLQFKSFMNSLLVFSGVFVAWGGGFMMLWLYQQEWFLNFTFFTIDLRELFQIRPYNLSIAIWVGFLALFGIATDDGVIMGTYISDTIKKETPKTVEEIRAAVLKSAIRRIRPAMMTITTTIIALLPILTASGKGADIMIPMAIPTFGGMLVGIITVFIVPVLFAWKEEVVLKYN
ncbi:MAG: acriflavine resistance protein B [Planctomycetota bacterium]|nr:MAG: acriflavine resistance protein B [Planctomycetota bacterium]